MLIRSKRIEVPQIEIEEEHWKVGDGMLSKRTIEDEKGIVRGTMRMILGPK